MCLMLVFNASPRLTFIHQKHKYNEQRMRANANLQLVIQQESSSDRTVVSGF